MKKKFVESLLRIVGRLTIRTVSGGGWDWGRLPQNLCNDVLINLKLKLSVRPISSLKFLSDLTDCWNSSSISWKDKVNFQYSHWGRYGVLKNTARLLHTMKFSCQQEDIYFVFESTNMKIRSILLSSDDWKYFPPPSPCFMFGQVLKQSLCIAIFIPSSRHNWRWSLGSIWNLVPRPPQSSLIICQLGEMSGHDQHLNLNLAMLELAQIFFHLSLTAVSALFSKLILVLYQIRAY